MYWVVDPRQPRYIPRAKSVGNLECPGKSMQIQVLNAINNQGAGNLSYCFSGAEVLSKFEGSETRSAENFYQNPIPIITLKLKTIFREIRRRNTVRNTGEKYEEVTQLEIQFIVVWARQDLPRTFPKTQSPS